MFDADVFGYAKYTFVESHAMVKQLQECGIKGVSQLPNFKAIPYFPDLSKALNDRKQSTKTHFVFLSRIMQSKGCNYILEATRILNEKGLNDSFIIDFYGKIDSVYKESFMQKVNNLDNVNYHGLLDLRTAAGYDTLSTYHAMLFPTIHPSEGFAGIFIDAFISGLPILASAWSHNAEFISHGKLGIIYPSHDAKTLANSMEDCILGMTDLYAMAINVRNEADKYRSDMVVTRDLLKTIGLIEK